MLEFWLTPNPPDPERLEYTQQLVAKLWAAVLVAMLYFFPGGPIQKLAEKLATHVG